MASSLNWSHLIKTHLSNGNPKQALLVYTQLRRDRIFNMGVVPLILKACSKSSNIHYGKSLHSESIKSGICIDVLIGTSLVSFYGKCGDIVFARKVYDEMPVRNEFTANAMISGYMRKGDVRSAQILFENMEMRTYVTWAEMVDGFSRNGDTVKARTFFDHVPHEMKNVVIWTVMVEGYASNGDMESAREVFEEMPLRNSFAWSSMVTGYFKKGHVEEARAIFHRIPNRNLVNWNSLISGYAQNGYSEEALEAYSKMKNEGFDPDEVTVLSVLSACAQLGLLDVGNEIHNMIIRKGIKLNKFVRNALVDMYAKCGDLCNAITIFDKMSCRNTSCWNSMISGFAAHGHAQEALNLFNRMEQSTEKADDITFLAVLSACAHGGFVNEGLEIFSKMKKQDIAAHMKHYGCLVDLLGRAGRLKDAYCLINQMPMKPSGVVLGSLLAACRIHMDADIAERIVAEFGPSADSGVNCGDDTHYVLMSNIYAASDNWNNAEKMRVVMVDKQLQKTPGCSSVMPSCNTDNSFHSTPTKMV